MKNRIIIILIMSLVIHTAFGQVPVSSPESAKKPIPAKQAVEGRKPIENIKGKVQKEQLSGEYKIKVGGNAGDKRMVISITNSDMEIIGSEGDEIIVQAFGLSKAPERADGLRPISHFAVDNSGVGLAITTEGNEYKVTKATKEDATYILKIPKKMAVSMNEIHWGDSDIKIANLEGEVEVNSKNSDVKIQNVTGPVVANSTSGDIIIVYSNLNPKKPNSISVIGGFVDITMPASSKANLNLNTMGGEIYSDLDIKLASKDGKGADLVFAGGSKVQATLNGGGTEVNINSIGGDIYLRKQK